MVTSIITIWILGVFLMMFLLRFDAVREFLDVYKDAEAVTFFSLCWPVLVPFYTLVAFARRILEN